MSSGLKNDVHGRCGGLPPKARDYLLMATHESGPWVFNPGDGHTIQAGAALVLLVNPDGRTQLEKRLAV